VTEFDDRVSRIFPGMWRERVNFDPQKFADLADTIVTELGPVVDSIDGDRVIREAAANQGNGDAGTSVLVLEAVGLIDLDHTPDAYVFAHQTSLQIAGASDFILDTNPKFAEETFWRFFEIASVGELSIRNVDRFSTKWDTRIVDWVATGRLPRDRVLAGCLDALNRDFGGHTSGWYSALFAQLKPSVEELAPLESNIRRLLGSSVGATSTLAVAACRRLDRAGLLDVEAFVAAAGGALHGTKASALTILAIAEDSDAEFLYTVALQHPHRDVQLAAAKWLIDKGLSAIVESSRAAIAPSVFVTVGLSPEPIELEPHEPVERVWPPLVVWPNDEIVERLAILLEDATEPIEVENGLRTLALTEDFDSLAPLAKAAQRAVRRAESYPNEGASISALIGVIVLAAAGIDHGPGTSRLIDLYPPLVYSRFNEVRERVLRRDAPHVLLATPIDSAGWVRPIDLAARITDDIWSADLTAALLRLSPDGRADARAALPGHLPREVAAVVAFALGGKAGKIRTPQWWVAAAQSLDPRADHKALISAKLGRRGQGRPVSARLIAEYTLNSAADRAKYRDLAVGLWKVRFDAGEKFFRAPKHPIDQPTVFQPQTKSWWELSTAFVTLNSDVAAFIGLTWPSSTEVVAYSGMRAIVSRSIYGEVGHAAEATLSAINASPGEIGELGRTAIVLSLSGKDVPLRRQAAEVFIDVVPARATVEEVAATLSSLIGLCTLTRLADSFADAAGLSSSAARTVTDLLIVTLPTIPRETTGLASLLSLLDDELLRSGRATDDTALRHYLGGFTGVSKATKSAKAMLGR